LELGIRRLEDDLSLVLWEEQHASVRVSAAKKLDAIDVTLHFMDRLESKQAARERCTAAIREVRRVFYGDADSRVVSIRMEEAFTSRIRGSEDEEEIDTEAIALAITVTGNVLLEKPEGKVYGVRCIGKLDSSGVAIYELDRWPPR
jgi:hypothetical protein